MDASILAFFARLPRQSPGSAAQTLTALGHLPELPPDARVADLACGTGGATLALAERLQAPILALDQAPEFLERLQAEAAARGLADKVEAVVGDMASPPVPARSLDLLWCEGAAYILGFDAALAHWRELLKPTGFAVVSECSWLVPNPGLAAKTFWYAAYPAMRTVLENIERAEGAGYELLATHTLPSACWAAYADSLEAGLADLATRGEALDADFVRALAKEIALFRNTGEEFSYVYYILARK
ncbi:class I SAM-dependent methyltransferase [Pedomonas mirosovicensis]|uniref:class I SAM-dependent methyltransferase n=1 Tax=Pedomonas mirosovicensis TaxID=2908641 RepID=UPI00216A3696|nr:class I SAM-dependent methyltransferase [Pedomonas mirosovicensis]MCH8685913.1 methyltransferase domain-containing protein [Pedomonas mirosovicensis]